MSLELDRNGVPIFAGSTDLFDEWCERARDLWYARTGNDSLQASTALALRGGLRDVAYEAAKKIPHKALMTRASDDTPTVDGVEELIEAVRVAIQQEKPVRVSETFESVFYDKAVWRSPKETMAAYIVRRKRDFDKLKDLSQTTNISDDIKVHLLLKFSGLSATQRSQVVASCNNKHDLALVETALRTQFPNIHEMPPYKPKADHHQKARWPKGKGSSSYGVWSANAEGPDYAPDEDEEEEEAVYEADEDGNYDVYEAADDDDDWELPDDDAEQSVLDAFAAFTQAKKTYKSKKKGKGKGGKVNRAPKKGKDDSTQSPPDPKTYKFEGSGTFTEQQKAERRRRISVIKQRTQCSACKKVGHWAGDPECQAKRGKNSSSPSAYFVTHDADEMPNGVVDIFVVDQVVPVSRFCRCFGKQNPGRGANADARWLDCGTCSERLVTAARKRRPGVSMGTSLWVYFMTNLFLRKNGREMFANAGRLRAARAHANDSDPDWEPVYMTEGPPSRVAATARRLLKLVPTRDRSLEREIQRLSDRDLDDAAVAFCRLVEARLIEHRARLASRVTVPSLHPVGAGSLPGAAVPSLHPAG